VHPARLYLLASILFFFAVTYWVKSAHLNPKNLTPQARAEIEADLEKKNLTPEQRANVEKALKILPPETADKIEQTIKRKETPAETPKMEDVLDKKPEAKKPDRPSLEFDNTNSASPPNRFEKWIEGHAKEKLGERGTNLVVPYHHYQQSPLHGTLLHPPLRLCPQNSLSAQTRFLHRPSCLRSPHSHVRLSGDYVDRARHPGIESGRAGRFGRMDCGNSLDDLCRANFSLDPSRLPAGLVYDCV